MNDPDLSAATTNGLDMHTAREEAVANLESDLYAAKEEARTLRQALEKSMPILRKHCGDLFLESIEKSLVQRPTPQSHE